MNDKNDLKKDENESKEEVSDVDKKNKREIKEKDDLVDEINDAINRLVEENGLDPNKVKILSVKGTKVDFTSALFTIITIIIFDLALFFAFSAVFNWATYSDKLHLLYFVLFFTGCEVVLKLASIPLYNTCIRKNYLLVPLVNILPLIVTGLLCYIMPVFINITAAYLYFLIVLLFYAIRRFYVKYLCKKYSLNL